MISDINECEGTTHNCSSNAVCHNINGSYNCICKPGYLGDGWNCTGDLEVMTYLGNDAIRSKSYTNNYWSYEKKKNEISGHDFGILGDKVIRLVNKMEGYPKSVCGSITNK